MFKILNGNFVLIQVLLSCTLYGHEMWWDFFHRLRITGFTHLLGVACGVSFVSIQVLLLYTLTRKEWDVRVFSQLQYY